MPCQLDCHVKAFLPLRRKTATISLVILCPYPLFSRHYVSIQHQDRLGPVFALQPFKSWVTLIPEEEFH